MTQSRALSNHKPGRKPDFDGNGLPGRSDLENVLQRQMGNGGTRGLLRVEEAAEWLGLGRTKAWELIYSGTLHSVTIGRSRRVPLAALQDFVERLVKEGGV